MVIIHSSSTGELNVFITIFFIVIMDVLTDIDLNSDYTLVYKDLDNIIAELPFETDEDRIMCQSIIESLEDEAVAQYLQDKCVIIPYIGKFQVNLIKKRSQKLYKDFKEAKSNMQKEDYLEYRKDVFKGLYSIIKSEEAVKRQNKHIKSKHFKLWNKLAREISFVYADCYIMFLNQMNTKHFDVEEDEVLYEYLTELYGKTED